MNQGTNYALEVIREFQVPLLRHLIWDDSFYREFAPAMTVIDFPAPSCQVIFEALRLYRAKQDQIPSNEGLSKCIHMVFHDPDSQNAAKAHDYQELQDTCGAIWSGAPLDPGFYRKMILDYLKKVRLLVAEKRREVLSSDEYARQVSEVHNLALSIPEVEDDLTAGAWSLPELVTKDEQIKRVPTNVTHVNKTIFRGLGRGEMGMVTACPGIGKTNSLINFATGAIAGGYHTLFITCELSRTDIKRRFQAITAEIPFLLLQENLLKWEDKYKQRFQTVARYYNDVMRGNIPHFYVIDRMGKQTTAQELRVTVERWQEKVNRAYGNEAAPFAVYIDWLKFMNLNPGTAGKRDKDHEILPEIVYQMRNIIAKPTDVALWSATQANNEAVGKPRLSPSHVGKAFGINEGLDVNLGLTAVDDHKLANRKNDLSEDDSQELIRRINRKLAFNTIKNRNSPPNAFELYQGESLRYYDSLSDMTSSRLWQMPRPFDRAN